MSKLAVDFCHYLNHYFEFVNQAYSMNEWYNGDENMIKDQNVIYLMTKITFTLIIS